MDNLTGGNEGERATGTPNTIYDLSSVLFHALEGGASYDTYIEDAEREGDRELADFFRRVRDEDNMRADEAQALLAERTPTATTTSTTVEPTAGGVTAEPAPTAETSRPGAPEATPEPRDVPRDVPPEDVEPGAGPLPRDVPPETQPR